MTLAAEATRQPAGADELGGTICHGGPRPSAVDLHTAEWAHPVRKVDFNV